MLVNRTSRSCRQFLTKTRAGTIEKLEPLRPQGRTVCASSPCGGRDRGKEPRSQGERLKPGLCALGHLAKLAEGRPAPSRREMNRAPGTRRQRRCADPRAWSPPPVRRRRPGSAAGPRGPKAGSGWVGEECVSRVSGDQRSLPFVGRLRDDPRVIGSGHPGRLTLWP